MTPSWIAKLAVAGATCLGAVGFARVAIESRSRYLMVDELMADPTVGRDLEVHGWISPGTIVRDRELVSFELQKDGRTLRVIGALPPCDCIKDQREVIVMGQLAPADDMAGLAARLHVGVARGLVLDATNMACKCPGKYDGARPQLDDQCALSAEGARPPRAPRAETFR